MESKGRIFSGVKPTGKLHLGHYIGILLNWEKLQYEYDCIFSVVDLHALTDPVKVKDNLQENIYHVLAMFIACGIDPLKAHIMLQSENSDHAFLSWILQNYIGYGQVKRMTQFKDQYQKHNVTNGLFNYPILMAADILLYDCAYVPVGIDQKQHLELARDMVDRFNSIYGQQGFKSPSPLINKVGSKVKLLSDPSKKMSKSDNNEKGIIFLLDKKEDVISKISRAVTDGENKIKYDEANKPGVSNLMQIYSSIGEIEISEIEKKYENLSYQDFKKDLIDIVWNRLDKIQNKYYSIIDDKEYLNSVLDSGLEYSLFLSNKKVEEIKKIIGLKRLN